MSRKKRLQGREALELIEEAFHLLRSAPLSVLSAYFTGTLPFALGFLYFWADMSRSASAASYAVTASLGLALLFVWMKCWQAVFCRLILARLMGEPAGSWTPRRVVRMLAVQAFIQPTGFAALPAALLMALPFGWVYAFYQNLSVLGDGLEDVRGTSRKAWKQSILWPGQNHILLGLITVFGIFVFLNVLLGMAMAPWLIKTFLGSEWVSFSGGWHIMNTTFLAVVFTLSWLCIDPLIKVVYTLRCFYGLSLRWAIDLRAGLNRAISTAAVLAILMVPALASVPAVAQAQEDSPVAIRGEGDAAGELDRAITEVLRQREYSWRMPRDIVPEEERSTFGKLMETLERYLGPPLETIKGWAERFYEWWEGLFPAPQAPEQEEVPLFRKVTGLQMLIFLLLAVAASILAVFIGRILKRRRSTPDPAPATVKAAPDLRAEEVAPDDLPSSRWIDLARELLKDGDLRLALRALYLATLAHLGEREMISIARFKTNMDYHRELGRRAGEKTDILEAFSDNVRTFDRIWYGLHETTTETIHDFTANTERILGHAG